MIAQETRYKLKEGYILLEDLENWYSHGLIPLDDTIQFIEKDGKVCTFKIETLIQKYGSEYPFRRIPPAYTSDELYAIRRNPKIQKLRFNWDSGKMELNFNPNEPVHVGPPKLMNGEIIPMDYPLFHVHNEPEEDRITGKDVIKEMEKLKEQIPVANWKKEYDVHFSFLKRRKVGDNRRVSVCRLCLRTPTSPVLFFAHLFKESHIKNLSKYEISDKSFQFWWDHVEKAFGVSRAEVERQIKEIEEQKVLTPGKKTRRGRRSKKKTQHKDSENPMANQLDVENSGETSNLEDSCLYEIS